MSNRKIVVVDYLTGGHHPTYINEFVQVLSEEGVDFQVVYPKLEELDKSFSDHYIPYKPVIASKFKNSLRFKSISLWFDLSWNLFKLKRKYKNQLVLINWMDSLRFQPEHPLILTIFKFMIWVFGPSKWIGLYFHPTHLRLNKGAKTSAVVDDVFKMKSCRGIAVLDNGIAQKLETLTQKPVFVFPDITNVDEEKNISSLGLEVLKRANGRKIVCLLGMQSKRKGVLSLIEVAKTCKEESLYFLFGGPLDTASYNTLELSQIKDFVASNPENCFFHFQHINDGQEFNELVKISDLVYAVYLNFPHSSNLLVKAAYFKKKVLVSDEYFMGELARKYQLGGTVNPHSLEEIRQKIINNSYLCLDDNLQAEFFALNSKQKLKNTIQKILKL